MLPQPEQRARRARASQQRCGLLPQLTAPCERLLPALCSAAASALAAAHWPRRPAPPRSERCPSRACRRGGRWAPLLQVCSSSNTSTCASDSAKQLAPQQQLGRWLLLRCAPCLSLRLLPTSLLSPFGGPCLCVAKLSHRGRSSPAADSLD